MESGTEIVRRPMHEHEQADRIRIVLGLTRNEPLPAPTWENLRKYHAFLSEKLSFPFNAEVWELSGRVHRNRYPVTVYHVLLPDPGADSSNGLLVEGNFHEQQLKLPLCCLQTSKRSANHLPLQDYAYWFTTTAAELATVPEQDYPASPYPGFWQSLWRFSVYGMGVGAVLGALLATQGVYAHYAMYIGAGVLAALGCALGSFYGRMFGVVNRVRGGPSIGALLGFVCGGVAGTAAGVLLIGYLGTVPGSILGHLLGKATARLGWKPFPQIVWPVVGACTGGMILSLVTDSDSAFTGAMAGILLGGVVTALLYVFFVFMLGVLLYSRK
jgi:Calcium binding